MIEKAMLTARTNRWISVYLALICVSFLLTHSNAVGQQPAIWESDFGSDLNLFDDDTASVLFGTFSFPFGGDVFTGADVLDVSSNGFVSLGGSNGNDCCSGDVTQFLNDPFPRISPLWADIHPARVASDGVFANSFNDDGDAADDRIAITWDAQHFGTGEDVLFQVQLFESGVISFGYSGISPLDRNTLIGIGPGGGASDPGLSDLSNGPFLEFSNNIYELFQPDSVVPGGFDLDGSNVVFTPIPFNGGFVVSQIGAIPEPSSLSVLAFACLASFSRRRR